MLGENSQPWKQPCLAVFVYLPRFVLRVQYKKKTGTVCVPRPYGPQVSISSILNFLNFSNDPQTFAFSRCMKPKVGENAKMLPRVLRTTPYIPTGLVGLPELRREIILSLRYECAQFCSRCASWHVFPWPIPQTSHLSFLQFCIFDLPGRSRKGRAHPEFSSCLTSTNVELKQLAR